MGKTAMQRRQFLVTLAAATAMGPMALAASYSDQIVAQLMDQGFRNITVSRTLLGRIRIRAQSDVGWREIILNPNTGEILRDLWTDLAGNPIAPKIVVSDDDGDDESSGGDDDSGGDDGSGGSGDDGSGGSGDDPDGGGDGETQDAIEDAIDEAADRLEDRRDERNDD